MRWTSMSSTLCTTHKVRDGPTPSCRGTHPHGTRQTSWWKADGDLPQATCLTGPLAPPSLDAQGARQAGDVPSRRVDGDADHVPADVQLLDREREQLLGHVGVEPQEPARQVHLQAAEGPDEQERGSRGPGLRRARCRVGDGMGELVPVEPAEELGEAVAEAVGRLEQVRAITRLASADEAVAASGRRR